MPTPFIPVTVLAGRVLDQLPLAGLERGFFPSFANLSVGTDGGHSTGGGPGGGTYRTNRRDETLLLLRISKLPVGVGWAVNPTDPAHISGGIR